MPALHDSVIRGKGRRKYYLLILLLCIGIPFQIFPYIWMLSNMFKTSLEIIQIPPTFFPNEFFWSNISDTFQKYDLLNNIKNTFVLCAGVLAVQLPISALAAYALSKLKPKGAKILLLFFLGTMMINEQALMWPTFLMMLDFPIIHVNLIDNFWSVILAFSAWGWAVFIFKGFFDAQPNDLLEAAQIDGATSLKCFTRIILPLTKPVFAVVGLNTFMAVYSQFLFPLILLPSEKMWTIMIRIYSAQQGIATWNNVMVMLTMATFPILILYFFVQKYIVEGVSLTGLKG